MSEGNVLCNAKRFSGPEPVCLSLKEYNSCEGEARQPIDSEDAGLED